MNFEFGQTFAIGKGKVREDRVCLCGGTQYQLGPEYELRTIMPAMLSEIYAWILANDL